MAAALKCDICGKYYDLYRKTFKNKTVACKIGYHTDIHSVTFDTCPDCLNSFIRFVAQKQKYNNIGNPIFTEEDYRDE